MKNFLNFQILLLLTSLCKAQVGVQYLINCGSSTNTTINTGQTFVGDGESISVTFSSRRTSPLISPNQPNASYQSIYQTARIFNRTSTYNFKISQTGTYFIRLHFCAFFSSLTDAKFRVYTSSRLVLIPDFVNMASTNCSSVIPKEFIISINNTREEFRLYFSPTPSSFAFVNAIELFSTTSYTRNFSVPFVTPSKRTGNYSGKISEVYETIYRINVGGSEVEGPIDILWRKWIPDDQYMINLIDSQNAPPKSDAITHDSGSATKEDGPDLVYGTAKVLKARKFSIIPNLTWQFTVNKNAEYFVRVHFCDIISYGSNGNTFSLNFYSNFSEEINPYSIILQADTPFYKDYVVRSDNLGFMNISIGPNSNSTPKTYMFLNGLEIMQVKNETAIIEDNHKKPFHMVLIVIVVVPLVLVLVFIASLIFYIHRKKKNKKIIEESEWAVLPLSGIPSSRVRTSESGSSRASIFQNLQLGLKIPFSEIQRVTNNFDANLIIGQGGFGKVYMGTLRSGLKVAVKRGSTDHGQGILEFQTEIMILSKIRHRHLVSLIGYCYENGEMILVYEFMEKGTLRKHLYESKRGNNSSSSTTNRILSWKQRLEICIGAAKGIQYLHTGTNTGIIHRDVKSTNILLDENLVAKVADFGLSRSGYLDQSHVSISDVKGTLGYLDPEYITCLQLTEKSDVYAFGVVLLEALCARPVIDLSLPREEINLQEWALAWYEKGEIEKIIDPSIVNEINPNSLKKFCETTMRCLNKNAIERPPMSDVCWGLEYALQIQKSETEGRVPLDDSTIDASLNMTLPAIRRFPSQNIDDFDYNDELMNTGSTGEVFSQLTFSDNVGR